MLLWFGGVEAKPEKSRFNDGTLFSSEVFFGRDDQNVENRKIPIPILGIHLLAKEWIGSVMPMMMTLIMIITIEEKENSPEFIF